MAFNGSGTFLINTAGQPVVSGTVISSTAFNALTADLATGLSTAITKDGQTTVTANIPMSTYKFTGLGVGSAATDSANLSQVQSTVTKLLNSVSGADTITATASPTLAAYAAGQMFYFVAAGDNTTSVTLNIDALGAKAVTRDGSTALVAADIKSGEVVVVVYDGTRFQVVSQLNSAGNATFANVSITSALNVGGVATLSGNLVFNSTAQRLTADMSNGTVSNRFAFQTSTTNGNTQVNAIPNGTSTTAQFIAYNNADSNNASSIQIAALSTATRLLSGQTGTGTYLPLTFFTSGSEQARLDTSGNFGIGTASPAYKLHVERPSYGVTGYFFTNDGTRNPRLVIYGSADGTTLQHTYSTGAGSLIFANGGAIGAGNEVGRFDASGNLGIGTASPVYRIDALLGAGSGNIARFGQSGVSNGYTITTNGSALTHEWANGGSVSMAFTSSGNLGIGTSSPNRKLEVNGISRFTDGTSNVEITNGGGVGYIGPQSNHPLAFQTNNTERARLTSGGDLLVGTTNVDARLTVTGPGNSIPVVSSKGTTSGDTTIQHYQLIKYDNDSTTSQVFVKFYINQGNSACGQINANGANQAAFGSTSDQRVKENIADLPSQLSNIMALRPVEFDYVESYGGGHQIGFVAQEMQLVYPDVISEDKTSEKIMSITGWSKTEARLVKAIQEQQTLITALAARIAALESK